MHASKGQNQRLVQALHSAEPSIHVSFRNKGAFECSKSKMREKITDVRSQLARKPYWFWGLLIRSQTTRTSASHNRSHIIPTSFWRLRGMVGHVHAAPVTSSHGDVILLTHPGDTSQLCCCRPLERQLTNLRWLLFSFAKLHLLWWRDLWASLATTKTSPPAQPDL